MTKEFEPTPEIKNSKIDQTIIDQGVKNAFILVERLPGRKNKEGVLDFHNTHHTENVIKYYKKIIEIISDSGNKLDSRLVQIGELCGAYHDTVQDFKEVEYIEPQTEANPFSGLKKIMRDREDEVNEKRSLELLINFMDSVNKEKLNTFLESDKELAKKIIFITIPGFDPKTKTIIQPNLNENVSVVERAIALSDLGSAGFSDSSEFVMGGSALFRENNLDIQDAMEELKNGKDIDLVHQEYFKFRMLSWSQSQYTFVKGRQEKLEDELKGLDINSKNTIKKELFKNFDTTLAVIEERVNKMQNMSFFELAQNMGYKI